MKNKCQREESENDLVAIVECLHSTRRHEEYCFVQVFFKYSAEFAETERQS